MDDKTYNGWKNRATWNVALWLNNDEGLYNIVKNFRETHKKNASYETFLTDTGLRDYRTPDGYNMDSRSICRSEIMKNVVFCE